MELKEGTSVYTTDGSEVGKINRFVMNPVTNKVTHVVVQKGLLFPEDKVIPIDWITATQEDRVTLSKSSANVQDLAPFEDVNYVPMSEEDYQRGDIGGFNYMPAYVWYPPLGGLGAVYPYNVPRVATETEQNIPDQTVAVEEGADVLSVDGEHVGDVERVFIDPNNNRATHFLISQGLLLKERKLVPIDWIHRVTEREIHLAVGSKFIDRLPDYRE